MADINGILRRSTEVNTSGAYNPPAIQATIQQAIGGGRGGGGVYTNGLEDPSSAEAAISGKVSLGFIGLLVVASIAFYLWTHEIQGGG